MKYDSKTIEFDALLDIARRMCLAARTAPKACGRDYIQTCILTGGEMHLVADEMVKISETQSLPLFVRDAQNIRDSSVLVVIGSVDSQRGLKYCQYCRYENCADCASNEGICIYDPIDLGIALGSAVSIAADARADNRILYTAGKAILSLGILPPEVKIAFGIPLSASGKSPYFDRVKAK